MSARSAAHRRRAVVPAGVAALAVVLAAAGTLPAHDLDRSSTWIRVDGESLRADLRFDLSDLVRVFHLDADGDGVLVAEEIIEGTPAVRDYLVTAFRLTIDPPPAELTAGEPWLAEGLVDTPPSGLFAADPGDLDPVLLADLAAGDVVISVGFPYRAALPSPPRRLEVRLDLWDRFGAAHRNFISVDWQGRTFHGILSPGRPRWRRSSGDRPSLTRQLGVFVAHGVEHIVIGYDHILFLLALVLAGGGFANLLKIVTAFTVAHSVTLVLAALDIVGLPSRLVECAIALSIAYVALENFRVNESRRRWIVAFLFGLVHGFGFATVLGELGLPTRAAVASLLAFNVGVEIGQMAIIAAALPLLLWLRASVHQRRIVRAASSVVLLFGIGWFVDRAFGLDFMPI